MSTKPRIAAIIVAAGQGQRAGGGIPKQWREFGGVCMADRTLDAFRSSSRIDQLVLVLHKDAMDRRADYPGVLCVPGGGTRDGSVRAGLETLDGKGFDQVLIHDVARPLVSQTLINRVLDALNNTQGAAPAIAVTDALWRGKEGVVTGTQDRAGLFRAQTPQGFHYGAILSAHRAFIGVAADDVEVARAAGLQIAMVPGEERNMKVTHVEDFARAERFLRDNMDIRTGNGFDVHAFGPGNSVMLCGVQIAHDHGLVGHSDADVGLHALTDALYGALAEGDIGQHFPPSDPKWKGAASEVFLKHAVELANSKGFTVNNLDVTLVCEFPKIGPHSSAMRAELCRITGLSLDRISVKATTSEKLGFTGRGEGIAALATATVMKT